MMVHAEIMASVIEVRQFSGTNQRLGFSMRMMTSSGWMRSWGSIEKLRWWISSCGAGVSLRFEASGVVFFDFCMAVGGLVSAICG